MNDQPLWIPTSNEPIVVHYIAPARELLAPYMPAGDAAQLARANELIEQHCQKASPPEVHVTHPAHLDQYTAWLAGYAERGGHPTHFYDYPYERVGFVFAPHGVMVDSAEEFGARSRQVIVPDGQRVARTAPGGPFDGWGHTNVFLMDGYRCVGGWVPAYSNPEFDVYRELADA